MDGRGRREGTRRVIAENAPLTEYGTETGALQAGTFPAA
jgi:hypothetical protein